jgi:NADPH:quinone reductase-like Zn-dependent oxidoreductase
MTTKEPTNPKMKAIVCTKYGPPEVLALKEVQKPVPKDDEVLIKIHATSVTASDVLMRGLKANFIYKIIIQAMMGFGKPRNPILGMVMSGVLEHTGANVTLFKPGDEVMGYGAKSMTNIKWGFYAEYMCLPEDWNLTHKPANMSFVEAAALPYGAYLAQHVIRKADLKANQKVLIYGASGSIGTMAIQFAKQAGVEVTAVCSSRNFDLVQSLGADKVIDYTHADAVSQLETYDWVLDTVGNTKTSALKEASKTALTPAGKYFSVDEGTPKTTREDLVMFKESAEGGKLKPVIDRCYPLEEMVQAHKYVEAGHKKGNVVISVDGDC